MEIISWQEIIVRLLFAVILGSATAIARRWYQTQQLIQQSTQIALGTAMLAILASSVSETVAVSQLILTIGIICVGISWHNPKQTDSFGLNVIGRLWCAGAIGLTVGFGLFVPAYIGTIIIIVTNVLFQPPEKSFVPNIEPELNAEPTSKTEPVREIGYRCQVSCEASKEAEVLALLVQLAKQHHLILIGITSKSLTAEDDRSELEAVMEVDFVTDSQNSTSQLQSIIINLQSQADVNSAKWIAISLEDIELNDQALLTSKSFMPKD